MAESLAFCTVLTSSACFEAFGPLTMGELNQCMRFPDAVKIVSGKESFIPALDIYLERLCDTGKTPVCSESVTREAVKTLDAACIDMPKTSGDFHGIARMVLHHYPKMLQAICSKGEECDYSTGRAYTADKKLEQVLPCRSVHNHREPPPKQH